MAFRNRFALSSQFGNANKGNWRYGIGEEGIHKIIRFLFATHKNMPAVEQMQ
jgi:hypothetical protein